MNLNDGPTASQLAQLLQGCNDDASHHMMWVDHGGEVHVTPLPRNHTPAAWTKSQQTLKFRLDTLVRGQKQVGEAAAANVAHLTLLLDRLLDRWSSAQAEGATPVPEAPAAHR